MNTRSFTYAAALLTLSALAQTAPAIQWQKALGGTYGDLNTAMLPTADGGSIVTGRVRSNDGDVTGNHGNMDAWVTKLDASGAVQWQRALGGTAQDAAYSVDITADGGYIMAGSTTSTDGDVTSTHGGTDLWVMKLDESGGLEWQRTFGGSGNETGAKILQIGDGGYVAAATTNSMDGDVTGNHGQEDIWVVKLDGAGDMQWQRTLGGLLYDAVASMARTVDGGYIVAGGTRSELGNSGYDLLVVKLDANGGTQWENTLGGSNDEQVNDIQQTDDGGYIVAGASNSSDGDVTGNDGDMDLWMVKLDAVGALAWQHTFGGSGGENGGPVRQTLDGGYIVTGWTNSVDGDVTGYQGFQDLWMLKLNSDGTLQWQRTLGGPFQDSPGAIAQIADGGFIVTGTTMSNTGDVTGNHGQEDIWVVKLAPEEVGVRELCEVSGFVLFPQPAGEQVTLRLALATATRVQLRLYTVDGRSCGTFLDEEWSAGDHRWSFSTSDLPSGIYQLQLMVDGRMLTQRMMRM